MQIGKWVAFGGSAFFLIIVAGAVSMPHLYYMAAILIMLPGVSYALGWHTLRGLTFSRSVSSPIWEGEETEIVYHVNNRSRIARFFLSIHEPFAEHVTVVNREPPLFNVGAGETTDAVHRVRFERRGVFVTTFFEVTAIDPLGVFAFTRSIACQDEIVAYPVPRSMYGLEFSNCEVNGWRDIVATTRRGDSHDPGGVRGYLPGDPLRHIHWPQTARTGNLSVIEFEENQAESLVIALDTDQETVFGEGSDTTLEYQVRCAASAANELTRQGVAVDLLLPPSLMTGQNAPSVDGFLLSGEGKLYAILDALARVEADSELHFDELLTSMTGNLKPGTMLLAITSRVDIALAETLISIQAGGVTAALVYVDPTTFDAQGQSAPGLEPSTAFDRIVGEGIPAYRVVWNREGSPLPVPIV